MLLIIICAIGAILTAIMLAASFQPAEFKNSRYTKIAAPPEKIFPHVNDLSQWAAWSPWENRDPQMTKTFEGPKTGKGAIYAWKGNKDVGEGHMTITECEPDRRIRIKLEFFAPFKCTNTAEFTFVSNGEETVVTWSMFGKNLFFMKVMKLFFNMDKMIGKDFEQGLAALKSVAESS